MTFLLFAVVASVVVIAGVQLARAGDVIRGALALPTRASTLARETGLGESFVGGLFVAVTTSLPEIAVSIAAVRIGALELGIANLLGSNLFNLLVLGLDDFFYAPGPLLGAVGDDHLVFVLAIVAMSALFLSGTARRTPAKPFRIAWETAAMILVYAGAVWLAYARRG
jgi:cation:H+ antiporter